VLQADSTTQSALSLSYATSLAVSSPSSSSAGCFGRFACHWHLEQLELAREGHRGGDEFVFASCLRADRPARRRREHLSGLGLAAENLLDERLAEEQRVVGIELASRPYQPSLVSVLKNNQRQASYHQEDGQP
jgi:hypothetical protein